MTDKVYLVYCGDRYDCYCVGIYKTKKSAWKYILRMQFLGCQKAQEERHLWGGQRGWKYEPYDRYSIEEREIYD